MNLRSSETVKICHFSDLHLPLARAPMPWQLMGKRSLGFANLKFNRGKTYRLEAFKSLLDHVAGESADLTIITGDLTSLSLQFEFESVDRLLHNGNLDPKKVLIIPGNHDRYTPFAEWNKAFEKGMSGWLPQSIKGPDDYPWLKIVGPVAVIALNTSVWRNPLRAAGKITGLQICRLQKILKSEEVKNRWPVIAMHHPPFHLRKSGMRDHLTGLQGVDKLVDALGNQEATLLHGHLHRFSRRSIKNLDVIGIPSASNDSGKEIAQLAYHTYCFDKDGLKDAFGTRHWPEEDEPNKRFERFTLPSEKFTD